MFVELLKDQNCRHMQFSSKLHANTILPRCAMKYKKSTSQIGLQSTIYNLELLKKLSIIQD